MDPFETLGIPPAFDVDLAAAEKAHRELSRTVHPDRFVGAGPSERRSALTQAVAVNEAWRTVRDPITRAEAILSLRGIAPSDGHDGHAKVTPEFLMEMLEQREALACAREERNLAAVRQLQRAVRALADETEEQLARGFARGQAAELVSTLGRLRFYRRLLDDVNAVEDELST
jgi:molecular chaperone HscB